MASRVPAFVAFFAISALQSIACTPPAAGPMIPITPEGRPLPHAAAISTEPFRANRSPETAPVHTNRSPEPWTPAVTTRIKQVQALVQRAAWEHRQDPDLINAVIWVESRFDPRAKSSAGARGLMQLMPTTARWLAESMGQRRFRVYDPDFNISAGTYYLNRLQKRYDGDVRWALAAYHGGPGNADRWRARRKIPDSSRLYIERVLAARAQFRAWSEPHETNVSNLARRP